MGRCLLETGRQEGVETLSGGVIPSLVLDVFRQKRPKGKKKKGVWVEGCEN